MSKNKDLVFVCRKCEHNLFLTNGVELTGAQIAKKLDIECPNCGEKGEGWFEGLWIYTRLGDFHKEYELSN